MGYVITGILDDKIKSRRIAFNHIVVNDPMLYQSQYLKDFDQLLNRLSVILKCFLIGLYKDIIRHAPKMKLPNNVPQHPPIHHILHIQLPHQLPRQLPHINNIGDAGHPNHMSQQLQNLQMLFGQ